MAVKVDVFLASNSRRPVSSFPVKLAAFALLLLLVPLGLGLSTLGGRLNESVLLRSKLRPGNELSDAEYLQTTARLDELDSAALGRAATMHRLLGLLASLAVLFVNGIVITYFVGTSRWCKEVATTYQMDDALWRTAAALKRKTFPWSVTAMLAVVVMVALGGASNPGTGRPGTADWVQWHLLGALAGAALIAWVFYIQWTNIAANGQLVDRIMGEVKRIRIERGLEVEG